jgi:hypothetical protein
MTRSQGITRRIVLGAGLAAVVSAAGCNPASSLYFLFRGDGKTPAEHPLLPKGEKKDVTVVILVSAPSTALEFAGLDRELASAVARKMFDQTKEGKHPIRAVETAKLDKFKAANPNWKAMSAADIGKGVGADYVLDITVANIDLYQPQTGKLMYQGRASVEAGVYDVPVGGGQMAKYFVNPKLEDRPVGDIAPNQYKQKLLDRIADEITWKHVAHVHDQRIAPPGS